jgi:hypothetical protein
VEGTRCIVGLRISDTRIEDVMGDIEETNYKSISIANALDQGIKAK